MKSLILPAICAAALAFASCDNGRSGASSTPIDSTNQTGAAPAQYQAGTPEQTVSPGTVNADAVTDDTSGKMQSGWAEPNGHGANSSNTTDKRTTSGSATHGDADGDRKR